MDLIVTFIQKKKKKNGSVMDTKVGGGVISLVSFHLEKIV